MERNPVTLRDIAADADVSIATVSLALRGKGRISDVVASRIREAADRLGYRKNVYAAATRAGNTGHVGIIIGEPFEAAVDWGFLSHLIGRIETDTTRRGFYPVIMPVSEDTPDEQLTQKIAASGAGGVFAIRLTRSTVFERLEEIGIPVVMVNNSGLQEKFSTVCVDDFRGVYNGVKYLIELGHRSIVFIEYERPENPSLSSDRAYGYQKALNDHGIKVSDRYHICCEGRSVARLQKSVEEVFRTQPVPTAVFAHDDYVGALVIRQLNRMGLAVPGDVSIIAAGDILDYTLGLYPDITTMQVDQASLAGLASNMLLERMEDRRSRGEVVKISEQLVDRGSCRAIREAARVSTRFESH